MTVVLDFPASLLGKRRNQNFHINTTSATLGRGLSGLEQTVYSENRHWSGALDFVTLTGEQIQEALAFGDELNGKANAVRLPVLNRGTLTHGSTDQAFYAEAGYSAADIARGFTTFEDGTTFADGAGFALPSTDEPLVSAYAGVGATSVTVEGLIGQRLRRGTYFSYRDYLYRCATNDRGTITFNPPLRAPIEAGSRVEVSNPTVQMKLADDNGWKLFVELARFGQPMSVNFIERLDR